MQNSSKGFSHSLLHKFDHTILKKDPATAHMARLDQISIKEEFAEFDEDEYKILTKILEKHHEKIMREKRLVRKIKRTLHDQVI